MPNGYDTRPADGDPFAGNDPWQERQPGHVSLTDILDKVRSYATADPARMVNAWVNKYTNDLFDPMARHLKYKDQLAAMKFNAAEAQHISDVVPRGDWQQQTTADGRQ
jgi:hypothetical protein